jgi:hypothetical protein
MSKTINDRSFKCGKCGLLITKRLKKPCPNCGEVGKLIELKLADSISIEDSIKSDKIREYFERHPILLPMVVLISIGAPFLGLFISGMKGVLVGLVIAVITFGLGLLSITKVREIEKRG